MSDEERAVQRLAELLGDDDAMPDADHDARAVQLIRVRRRVGDGSIDDPNRVVATYHTLRGDLVYTDDPQPRDDPRIELLQSALREALHLLDKSSEQPDQRSDDEIALIRRRIPKLEKLTDPEWRPT